MEKDRVLTDYLLGKLDDSECEAIEQEYFASSETLEGLTALEEQLFDDYAANKLQAGDRLRFERRFLKTGADRAHLDFARNLFEWTRHVRRRKPFFNFAWWPEVEAVMAQESIHAGKIEAQELANEELLLEIPSNGLLEIEVEAGSAMYLRHLLLLKNDEGHEVWRSEMTPGVPADSLKAQVPCGLLSEERFTLTVYGETNGALDPILEQAVRFRKRPSA